MNPTVNGGAPRRFFSEALPDLESDAPCEQGVVRGLKAVAACGEAHGLVESHLGALAALAQKQRVAFGFRPVNPLATQLIKQGYPTKGLDIKGKSADWGPMAGFIPISQRFSKVAGSPKDIARLDDQIRDCIDAGDAVSMPLVLGSERLATLSAKGVIRIEGEPGRKHLRIVAEKDQCQHIFEGRLIFADGICDYGIFSESAPLQVLAKPGTATDKARPLTADYDLLLFAVPIQDLDNRDNYRDSPVNNTRPKSLLKRVFGKTPDVHGQKPMPGTRDQTARAGQAAPGVSSALFNHGISSPRLDRFISTMNGALGRTDANRLVQHGPDTHNPYTVLTDNYPSVIFMAQPDKDAAEVVMVQDQSAAVAVYGQIKDCGFQFFGNDNWAEAIPKAAYRRPSYNRARDEMGTGAASAALSPFANSATPLKQYHRPSHDRARDAMEAAIASLNLSSPVTPK